MGTDQQSVSDQSSDVKILNFGVNFHCLQRLLDIDLAMLDMKICILKDQCKYLEIS